VSSLTVGQLDDDLDQVTVWLIPETLAKTNLSKKQIGDSLNIEVDVLAKCVERLIAKGEEIMSDLTKAIADFKSGHFLIVTRMIRIARMREI
jgi:riboflavin synthase alpha subunit